jgi:hypothetical protein
LGRIVMPPWTHIPRRRGTRLSQFDAPVSPSPLPSVFENSHNFEGQVEDAFRIDHKP